ncbi:MAG: choice-of-anchor D domain-containing protein [Verrucomicrobiaceae bacterium]
MKPAIHSLVLILGLEGGLLSAPGDLDTTFSFDGVTTVAFPGSSTTEEARAAAMQADGRIVLVGKADSDFALMRLNPDGTADSSFGTGGKVAWDFFGGVNEAYTVAVQADGKIVVAGRIDVNGNGKMGVVRFLGNGQLDETFASAGIFTTSFEATTGLNDAEDIAIQADGKIVVAGRATNNATGVDYGIIRLTTGGVLDTGFGTGGKVTVDFPGGDSFDQAQAVLVQADGKIVVAGATDTGPWDSAGIIRLETNGALDAGFGTGGLVVVDFGTRGLTAYDVALQSSGKIIVGGRTYGTGVDGISGGFALARLTTAGVLDTSFGTSGTTGRVFVGSTDNAGRNLAIRADDSIVLSGAAQMSASGWDFALMSFDADGNNPSAIRFSESFGQSTREECFGAVMEPGGRLILAGSSALNDSSDFAMIRLTASLDSDTGWSTDGMGSTTFGSGARARAAVQQSDGNVILAGRIWDGTRMKGLVARYDTRGSLDASFNGGGTSIFVGASGDDEVAAAALQADGKVVVAGSHAPGGDSQFAVWRLGTTGLLDSAFGSSGGAAFGFGFTDERANAVLVQSDGKVVMAGRANGEFALVRVLSDGTLDSGFGSAGKAQTSFAAGASEANGAALDASGRIVVAGFAGGDVAIARFDSSGALDTSFGSGGKVTMDLFGGSTDAASAVLVLPDGDLMIACTGGGDFAALRLNADGSVDTAFGTAGVARVDVGAADTCHAIARRSDGSLFLSGESAGKFACVALQSNGTLLTSFGGGSLTTDVQAGADAARAVIVQTDGRVLLAGVATDGGGVEMVGSCRYNANGTLDQTFGGVGPGPMLQAGQWPVPMGSSAQSVLVQPDGKIVTAGNYGDAGLPNGFDFALSRHLPDGALDTSFGSGGTLITHVSGASDVGNDVVLQPDGKIVAVGQSGSLGTSTMATVVRYTSSGALDATFGTGGIVAMNHGAGVNGVLMEVVLDAAGRIVTVGRIGTQGCVLRFLSDGSLDTSFGSAGISSPIPSSWVVNGLVIQPDGKIVITGNTSSGGNGFIARVDATGANDANFGTGGVVQIDNGVTESFSDLAVDASGRIVAGGYSGGSGINNRVFLVRVLSNGNLDTSFDSDGMVTTVLGDSFTATTLASLRIQPDGAIVAGGTWFYNKTTSPFLSYQDFLLLRYLPDGSLDPTFGTGGYVRTQDTSPEEWKTNGGGDNDILNSIELAPNGKIVAVGNSSPPYGTSFGIARYETGLACEIAVEEPASNDLTDGTASRDFGSLPVGQSAMKTFVIRNTGYVDLTGLAVTKSGANAVDVTTGSLGATTLAPGASTTFTVTFTPSVAGTRNAAIQIASNDADENPFDIALTATGAVPEIAVEQPSGTDLVDGSANAGFGSVVVGASTPLTFTVRNLGNADLTGLAVSIDGANSGDFVAGAPGATTLTPGTSTTFTVTFTPSAAGARAAALHLASNDADENPFDILLNGTGTLPAPGELDPSFGTGGKVTTAIGTGDDVVRAIAVQADGKIVLAGEANISGGDDFALARHNADGTLDTSFGTGGKVTTPFAGTLDWARAVAIQPDGKIVAAGSSGSGSGTDDFAVARYLANGTLDTTFSGDGKLTVSLGGNDDVSALCLQTDGKIVVVGSVYTSTSNVGVIRLNADGTLDNTFSGDGILLTTFGGNDNGTSVALQADGKIVIGGYSFLGSPTNGKILITRLNADGTLDSGFGTGGKVNTDTGFNTPIYALMIRPDGRILLGGGRLNGSNWDFLLASYTAAGVLDTSFGSSGLVVIDFGGNETIAGLARQPNGKIIAAGTSNATGTNDFAVSRLLDGGSLDTTFNTTGKKTIAIGSGSDTAACAAIDAGGSILLGGTSYNGTNNDFALVRIAGDPLVPEITVEQPAGSALTDAVSSVSFANVLVATSAQKTFTIRNDGTANLSGLAVTVDGTAAGDFSAGSLGSNDLAPGASTTFTVTFTPSTTGLRSASLHIASNDEDENPFDIALDGTGVSPEITIEQPAGTALVDGTANVDFGTRIVGSLPATRTFTLRNDGTATLNSIGLTIDGAQSTDFTVSPPLPATLAPGASTTFTVSFTPGASGSRTAALHIASSDADENPFDITVSGTGVLPGALDPSFGTGGKVTTAIGSGDDVVRAIAVQADGKIVLAGESNISGGDDFALARYNADGTLDTTFGTGGKVTTPFAGTLDWARSVAIQPDGKIVAAGSSGSGSGTDDFAVARYLANGTLDTTFSGDGKFTVSLGGNDDVSALCLQPDGKIVVVGSVYTSTSNVGVIRLNTDGTLDNTFSGDGILLTTFGGNDNGTSVALQADGKIVIGGYSFLGSPTNGKILITRLNADGTLDSGFGTGGKVNTDTGFNTPIYALMVRPDGRILLGGGRLNGSNWDFLLASYTTAGAVDTSFGASGLKVTSLGGNETIAGLTRQPNGKIIAIGTSNAAGTNDFALVRYLDDGTPDSSFGVSGTSLVPVGSGSDVGSCVAMQSDGYILAAGHAHNGSNNDFALVRIAGDPLVPEISVEQPAGAALTDAVSSVSFGALAGSGSQVQTFTIRNDGTATLTLGTLSIDGAQSSEFAIDALGTNVLAPGASTTFTVTFTPGALGARTDALHIASDDSDENPFDIALAGTGWNQVETWRQQYFGTTSDTGDSADLADPEHDGICNLIEFATGTHPLQSSPPSQTLVRTPGNLTFTYQRTLAALANGVTFTVQHNATLSAGGWDGSGVVETILSDNGTLQVIEAQLPAPAGSTGFARLQIQR